MVAVVGPLVREVYRRELIPARVRWWLAAAGMIDFARVLARDLRPHLGDQSREVVAGLAAKMFERRWAQLGASFPSRSKDQRTSALIFSALYRVRASSRASWIFSAIGGPARGLTEVFRAEALLRALDARARWEEVTVHLGELLIVATEELPARLGGSRKILGDICFAMGARYAEQTKRFFRIPPSEATDPQRAIELLRMSEYIFRVNPEHWSEVHLPEGTGMLEGTACPWYDRPGWNAGHCGIFGQFQAGISAAFGLKYRLTETIPRHGGSTCRIDLVPLPSAKKR